MVGRRVLLPLSARENRPLLWMMDTYKKKRFFNLLGSFRWWLCAMKKSKRNLYILVSHSSPVYCPARRGSGCCPGGRQRDRGELERAPVPGPPEERAASSATGDPGSLGLRYYPITKLNSGWFNFITIDVLTSRPGGHSLLASYGPGCQDNKASFDLWLL